MCSLHWWLFESKKKLAWDGNDEPDLVWKSSALLGAPVILGAGGKLPLLSPPFPVSVALVWSFSCFSQPVFRDSDLTFTTLEPQMITSAGYYSFRVHWTPGMSSMIKEIQNTINIIHQHKCLLYPNQQITIRPWCHLLAIISLWTR